jgi:hypothetical protein
MIRRAGRIFPSQTKTDLKQGLRSKSMSVAGNFEIREERRGGREINEWNDRRIGCGIRGEVAEIDDCISGGEVEIDEELSKICASICLLINNNLSLYNYY